MDDDERDFCELESDLDVILEEASEHERDYEFVKSMLTITNLTES